MPDWITATEAATISGYNLVYLRTLIQARKIKARKFGPTWQVSRASLQAYMRASEASGDARRGPRALKS